MKTSKPLLWLVLGVSLPQITGCRTWRPLDPRVEPLPSQVRVTHASGRETLRNPRIEGDSAIVGSITTVTITTRTTDSDVRFRLTEVWAFEAKRLSIGRTAALTLGLMWAFVSVVMWAECQQDPDGYFCG